MSALLAGRVSVPGGKREHIGIAVDNNWRPICGQRCSNGFWLPSWMWKRLRAVVGPCRGCIAAASVIADIGQRMAEESP